MAKDELCTYNYKFEGFEQASLAKHMGFKVPVIMDSEVYDNLINIDDSEWADENDTQYLLRVVSVLSCLRMTLLNNGVVGEEIEFVASLPMKDGMEVEHKLVASKEHDDEGSYALVVYINE